MIATPPLSGCPFTKPATPNWRWPTEVKGTTIEATTGIIMNHWVCRHVAQPSGRKGPPPPTTHMHQRMPTNRTLVPRASRPSGVTIVGPTAAIATHTTSQNHRAEDVRRTIDTCCGPGPDIATVWQCPTPAYTHTARRCTNNTQSHGHRAVCPSATIMSTKYRDRTTTGRNATTAARTHWGAPPFGDDTPGRRRLQRKGKRRCMNKGVCANTDLCPLASPRVALVGLRAATRGAPCQTTNATLAMAQ